MKRFEPHDDTIDEKITFNASASSSKAVLAALRALQDKIRRLEAERCQAIDEATQLRNQISTYEIEYEHKRRQDNVEHQKSIHVAHIANEKLLLEKEELQTRLEKIECQTTQNKQELSDLLHQITVLEGEKKSNETRLRDVEKDYFNLQQDLKASQQREKDLSQTMVWESKLHQEEMIKLSDKLQAVRQELAEMTLQRTENEMKLQELDHLVGQLLSVNEALVSNFSNPRKKVVAASKITVKSRSRSRSNSASRLSSGTISSELKAKRSSVNNRKRSPTPTRKRTESIARTVPADLPLPVNEHDISDAQYYSKLHDMFVAVADTVTRGRRLHSTSTTTRHILDSDMPPDIAPENFRSRPSTRIRHRSASKYVERESAMDELTTPANVDEQWDVRHSTRSPKEDARTLNGIESSTHTKSSVVYSSPGKSTSDLQNVIKSLEEEFDILNHEYYRLVSMRPDNDNGRSEARHAEELVTVIKQLHRKGEQIRALKSPSKQL